MQNETRRPASPPRIDLNEAVEQRRKRVAAQDDDAVTTTPRQSPDSDIFDDYDGMGYDSAELNSDINIPDALELMEVDPAVSVSRRHSTDGRHSDNGRTPSRPSQRPQSADARVSPPPSPYSPAPSSPAQPASPPERGRPLTRSRDSRSRSHSSGPRATALPPARAHSSATPTHRARQPKSVVPPPPSPRARKPFLPPKPKTVVSPPSSPPRATSPAARPRRTRQPQQPPPASPTSSDLSSSDEYGKLHALAEKERQRVARYDPRALHSLESEDEEETRTFELEVADGAHGEDDAVERPTQSRKKSARSVRGKNKHVAVDGADEGDATETAPAAARKAGKGKGKSKSKQVEEEEDDDDEEGEGVYSRGPVPQAIRDRLAALKESFHSQVADLAAECNKSPTVLHRILGTTSASPRALAPWNIHQMKYAVDVPFKDSGRECSSFFLCFI